MTARRRAVVVLALALAPLAGCDGGRSAAPRDAEPKEIPVADLLEVYEYDPKAPLPFRFADEVADAGGRSIRFTFRTWEREPVDGLIALPKDGAAPYPTVVYFHRIVEDESAAIPVRDALRDLGVAVLAVRLPVKRFVVSEGEAAREKRMQGFRNRRMAVLEACSALDAVVARGLADPARVATVGASAGGGPAVVFGAVEPRSRAVAAVSSGAADFARGIPERSKHIEAESRRTVASVDPLSFAPLVAPRPLLVIRGELDPVVTDESAKALLAAAREPKRMTTIPGEAHRIALEALGPVLVDFLRGSLAAPPPR